MCLDKTIANLTIVGEEQVDTIIENIVHTQEPIVVGFLNQHGYNLISRHSAIESSFSEIDYLLRDGKGIEYACRYNGLDPKKNLNGTDFIPLLIRRVKEQITDAQFFSYGTEAPWLERGSKNLFGTEDAYCVDGFQDDEIYVEHFQSLQSEQLTVVVLAMGMPKQERIAGLLKNIAKGPVIIICGGAILDFQSGRVKRAPTFFRKLGLEWLYRLLREPKRLFNRYVIGIPLFFINIYRAKRATE
ncbi:WecB/TagA/CpsF family glycosyltransferase [Vibrio europaeus]|uniref:WecB/TagA/CpsF family glycosyltransferase n=1 Tax=Vibrio europaeus TaxID=300876 RepID=UPI0039E0C623